MDWSNCSLESAVPGGKRALLCYNYSPVADFTESESGGKFSIQISLSRR